MKMYPAETKNRPGRSGGLVWVLLALVIVATVCVAGCSYSFSTPSPTGSPAASGESTPWTGTWDTIHGTMDLTQSKNQVTGTYGDAGRITGTVSGNTLTGTWSEPPSYQPPDGAGDFTFTLSADGNSFSGNWRYGSGTGDWDGSWSGTRK
jgi:hypothetical protein